MSHCDETNDDRQHQHYRTHGWLKFNYDPKLENWVKLSLPSAQEALTCKQNQHWWRYQGTWFVGVNCLDNNSSGMVEGGVDLQGNAVSFLRNRLGANVHALDLAQISVCYPGYPQASEHESVAASRYRLKRDAAHIDGLLKEGAEHQRYVREPHDYILAIAMSEFSADASPFVVWPGSHHLARTAFKEFFAGYDPQSWSDTAITECYKQLRKKFFYSVSA